MNKHKPFPQNLKLKARENRKAPTKAEAILWESLRGHRLGGYKFRRQHPIPQKGHFILDFYCEEQKLAVEADGNYHLNEKQADLDSSRTEILNELEIRVIRFSNEAIIHRTDEVLNTILDALQED